MSLFTTTMAHAASPGVVSVTLPDNVNSCAKSVVETDVRLTSKCSTIVVVYCLYGRTDPVWRCASETVTAQRPEVRFPVSRGSFEDAYVGACRPAAARCLERQRWLMAAVDGRQNPYLAVNLMKPGLKGEPLHPLALRRRAARG